MDTSGRSSSWSPSPWSWSVCCGSSRAQRPLRDAARLQNTLTSLAETTHDWLWRTDREGRITYSNSGSTLLGYLPDDVTGRKAYELIDPAGLPEWQVRVADLGRLGLGWSDITLHMRHRDGHLVDIECSAAPVDRARRSGRGLRGHRPAAVRRRRTGHDPQPPAAPGRAGPERPLGTDRLPAHRQPLHRRGRRRRGPRPHRLRPVHPAGRLAARRRRRRARGQPRAAGAAVRARLGDALPPNLYISINASPRTIADPAFLELLLSHDTALDRLVLEITEHESVADYEPLTNTLGFARSRGLRLAVDDAGLRLRLVPAHPHAAPRLHQARPRPHRRHRHRRGAAGPGERRRDVRARARRPGDRRGGRDRGRAGHAVLAVRRRGPGLLPRTARRPTPPSGPGGPAAASASSAATRGPIGFG